MDSKNEDKIVRQIEKNLSNNMNDNLFLTGRAVENNLAVRDNLALSRAETMENTEEQNITLVSGDYITNPQGISRAEYIRQAREACLRQLSSVQIYSRPYDINYMENEEAPSEQLNYKKSNVMKLFRNHTEDENTAHQKNKVQEAISFRSLIIRCVLAIVLFLGIFIYDKFDIKVANITSDTIKEYVTGNDALEDLENLLVTWLK